VATYTTLKYVQNAGDFLLTEQLKDNLGAFFDYGLVNTGHFVSAHLAQSGAWGDNTKLHIANAPSYSTGQVWQGKRKNWIYETDTDCTPAPISVSGVYVNSTFYPIGTTGTYEFNIDYKNGRVIFTTPLTTGTVNVEHSYKYVQIERASHPFFRAVQLGTFKAEDSELIRGSGTYNIPPENRVQFPVIFIEVPPDRSFTPYQLGAGTYTDTTVNFHIVSENDVDLGRLVDIVSSQYQKTIWLYNKNTIPYPLNEFGFIGSGYVPYTQLVSESGYRWKECAFIQSYAGESEYTTNPLYNGTVKLLANVIMPEI